LINTATAKL